MNKDTIKIKQALEAANNVLTRTYTGTSEQQLTRMAAALARLVAALSIEQQEEAPTSSCIGVTHVTQQSDGRFLVVDALATPDAQPQEQQHMAVFAAYSDCLANGSSMTPLEITDKLIAAANYKYAARPTTHSAAPVQPQEQPKLPAHMRRSIERAMEDAKRGMQLNDGKERVTLPGGTLAYLLRLAAAAPVQPQEQPNAPHILEALSWHANERDDLTLDDAVEVIRHGWKKVHGRSERQLVLQIASLLAAAPSDAQPQAEQLTLTLRDIQDLQYAWDRLDHYRERDACIMFSKVLSKLENAFAAPVTVQPAGKPEVSTTGVAKDWSVTVEVEGLRVLCISSGHIAGVPELEPYEATIQCCAENLLSFIGCATSDAEQDEEPEQDEELDPHIDGVVPTRMTEDEKAFISRATRCATSSKENE